MIPEWIIVVLAMLGICAFVIGKAKWALALCSPALWAYVVYPISWEILKILPLWIAIAVLLIVGARVAFGTFVQLLSAIFGRHVAEDASGHVLGHYLQRSVGACFRGIGWLIALPFRIIVRLFD